MDNILKIHKIYQIQTVLTYPNNGLASINFHNNQFDYLLTSMGIPNQLDGGPVSGLIESS